MKFESIRVALVRILLKFVLILSVLSIITNIHPLVEALTYDPYADYGVFLNILPPGQSDKGGVSSIIPGIPERPWFIDTLLGVAIPGDKVKPIILKGEHFDDQLEMYSSVLYAESGISDDDLLQYFKPEIFHDPKEMGEWESEKRVTNGNFSAVIKRDEFGVPHVYGDTGLDVKFGAGYVTAEDRLFLLDIMRRAGRGELSKFLGPADFSFDLDIGEQAPYREEDRTIQYNELDNKFGSLGEQIIEDGLAFIDGVNTYVEAIKKRRLSIPLEYIGLGLKLEKFVPEDIVAIATLIQAIFASGGG